MQWRYAAAISAVVGGFLLPTGFRGQVAQAQASSDELAQLVAPIALYPDELVAEVLAAATYPAQIDEAEHWLQQNASLPADQIADGADKMDWDPSVKALTEFPSALAMMDQNLSWVSALGDAYFNQPDDVMDAVQALRQRAIAAGTLQSSSQIAVNDQNDTIAIEPADQDTVYVPTYDSWAVYGAPIPPWPEFVFAPGLVRGPHVRWDAGIHLGGAWGRVNWGWHNWAFDWSHRRVDFHRNVYVSHSPSVVDRHYPPHAAAVVRGGAVPRAEIGPSRSVSPGRSVIPGRSVNPGRGPETHAVPMPKPAGPPKVAVDHKADRGFPQTKPTTTPSGTRSGAFGGFNHGGVATANAERGRASMGGHPAPPPPPPANGRGRGRS